MRRGANAGNEQSTRPRVDRGIGRDWWRLEQWRITTLRQVDHTDAT